MSNEIFNALASMLATHLGGSSQLDSGNGVRFKSARKGKATAYFNNIAPGNQAEVAFDVASMASRLCMRQDEFRSFVEQLRTSTGRPVEINNQHKWPRVGMASEADVTMIREALQRKFASLRVT